MHDKAKEMPEAGKAILAGDIEAFKALLDTGAVTYRKGKTTYLKRNIPKTYTHSGKTTTVYADAFGFALSRQQTEIVKLLIDRGLVDMGPGADAPFMAIRSGDPALFFYMLDKGAQIGKEERQITRLFLNLMDCWDEAYPAKIQSLDLPLETCGGPALCYAAGRSHMPATAFLLSAGVPVNSTDRSAQNTPVFCAAKENHSEMVKFLVEHGADLTLRNAMGLRPYLAAKANGNEALAAYIKAHEPAELHSETKRDSLFAAYHVPKALCEYLKNGNLRLEFPEEEALHWIKLYSYMDVPEMTYRGKKLLSLVEDSEDYDVMLLWEPRSRKIWYLDMEHDVFHAVSTWSKFIKNAGRYTNKAVMWEFD